MINLQLPLHKLWSANTHIYVSTLLVSLDDSLKEQEDIFLLPSIIIINKTLLSCTDVTHPPQKQEGQTKETDILNCCKQDSTTNIWKIFNLTVEQNKPLIIYISLLKLELTCLKRRMSMNFCRTEDKFYCLWIFPLWNIKMWHILKH